MYRKSAEQGYPEAQYRLAQCLANSSFSFETTKSDKWEKNEAKAFQWYLKAAEQGYADAQSKVGDYYYDGIHLKENYDEAFKWYSKAAEQGCIDAQRGLS